MSQLKKIAYKFINTCSFCDFTGQRVSSAEMCASIATLSDEDQTTGLKLPAEDLLPHSDKHQVSPLNSENYRVAKLESHLGILYLTASYALSII